MHKTLLLLLITANPQSYAQTSDLWSLLGNGETVLPGGNVVYQLISKNKKERVTIGLSFEKMTDSGYNSLDFSAFKFNSNFTKDELKLIADNIMLISVKCFNISSKRKESLERWVLSNNAQETHFHSTSGTHASRKILGPVTALLQKRVNGKGHSIMINLSRKGEPGVPPWINHCITSG